MSAYWCVIPAAGHGTRFGGDTPKQFVEVAGKPVFRYALDALLSHPRIAGAVMVLPEAHLHEWPLLAHSYRKPVLRCAGGDSRAASVANALRLLSREVASDAPVLVHDAARPNISHGDLDALFAALIEHPRGAILAAPVRDTLKRADAAGDILATEPRESLWRAFTPQAFPRRALLAALETSAKFGIDATDEAVAMERVGVRAHLVEGREDNFKITTPADLERFAFLVSQR